VYPVCDECADRNRLAALARDFSGRLTVAGIPQEYWNYDRALGNEKLVDWCHRHRHQWLWIGGKTGITKTRAACFTATQRMWETGCSASFIDCAAFFDEVRCGNRTAIDRLRLLRNASLLILDDFGQEALDDRTAGRIFTLIRARADVPGRQTWFTTNANGEELEQHLGETRWLQIRRRIKENGPSWPNAWDGAEQPAAGEYWWEKM